MARNETKRPAEETQPRKARRRLTAVLLLAAAAVVGLTIYVAVHPPWASSEPAGPEPGLSEAAKTRRVLEGLLANADAQDPRGGPLMMVARRQAYERACDLARRFIQMRDRNDVVVRPILAQAQLRLGRLAEAERTIDDLLRLAPGSAEGLMVKARLVKARGGEGALAFLRRAAESTQATPRIWARYGTELLAEGQIALGREYLQRAYDAGERDRQTLLNLAVLATQGGQFERAASLLNEVVQMGRPSLLVLSRLAEAQKDAGKLPAAEKTLRQALAGRESPELRLQLGNVLLLQRRRREAAEAYAKAAEHPLAEAAGAFRAARVYYLLGRYAAAMKYIDRAADHAETPEVRQWRKTIEDARFGEPAAEAPPAFRLPPPDSLPPEEEVGNGVPLGATTQPLRLLP